MSAAKHTPGPWTLAIGRYILCRDGQTQIAVMDKSDDWDDEQEANARLIAAAPELLAFAKWAMDQFCGESGTGESHWEQFPEFVAGQAAITKAEGGQS